MFVMIEVFKTNVRKKDQASMLVASIENSFAGYQANFDLDDCDNILRVQRHGREVCAALIIDLLERYGFDAEVLPDTEPVFPEYLNVDS
jgi:hypothetical protein